MTALSRFMSYRPEREGSSQSLRKPRVKPTRRDGCDLLLAAGFVKLREHLVGAGEPVGGRGWVGLGGKTGFGVLEGAGCKGERAWSGVVHWICAGHRQTG